MIPRTKERNEITEGKGLRDKGKLLLTTFQPVVSDNLASEWKSRDKFEMINDIMNNSLIRLEGPLESRAWDFP